ncbi:MAG: hypothetical protein KGJ07_06995 [Patescibacteria group bacterium]|nr:hypothetical protein [Patescibacteria group bacterium]
MSTLPHLISDAKETRKSMPICSRVYCPEMKINYEWMFEISSVGELLEYWSTRKNLVEEGVYKIAQQDSASYNALLSYCKKYNIEHSEMLKILDGKLLEAMQKEIDSGRSIFVAKNGNWITSTDSISILDTWKIKTWELPETDETGCTNFSI